MSYTVMGILGPDEEALHAQFQAYAPCPMCKKWDYHRFWEVFGVSVRRICSGCGYGWWQS